MSSVESAEVGSNFPCDRGEFEISLRHREFSVTFKGLYLALGNNEGAVAATT